MDHSAFRFGEEFLCGGKRWRCTDIGHRTIIAICLEPHEIVEMDSSAQPPTKTRRVVNDPSWFNGPPYAVAEYVFDEDDIEGCTLQPEEGHENSPRDD
jgi:hypothetical protein